MATEFADAVWSDIRPSLHVRVGGRIQNRQGPHPGALRHQHVAEAPDQTIERRRRRRLEIRRGVARMRGDALGLPAGGAQAAVEL